MKSKRQKPNFFKKYLIKVWIDSARLNNQILQNLVEPTESAKILDIGCSEGKEVIKITKNIKKPQIWGIDIDNHSISRAKKLGIYAIKHNIENGLPLKSKSFDLVIANQIIEHILNVDLFIKELKRIIKPQGYLLVATENLSSWHNLAALFLGWQAFSQHLSYLKNIGNPMRMAKYTNYDKSGMHIKIFTPRGLTELLKLYGFEIEAFYGAGYYPFTSYLSKILSKIDRTHTAFIGAKARKGLG